MKKKGIVKRMTNTLKSIPSKLGNMRRSLMDEGYSEGESFQIVLDLIRRGDSPKALFED